MFGLGGAFLLLPLLTREAPKQGQNPLSLKKNAPEAPHSLPAPPPSRGEATRQPPSTPRQGPIPGLGSGGVLGEIRDVFERPIQGAYVQIQLGGKHGPPLHAKTDAKGTFRIPFGFVGPFFLFARHPDFAPLPKPLFLEHKNPGTWLAAPKITLLSGRRLVFRFLDPNGNPLPRVRALLQKKWGADRGPFGDPPREGVSDPSGQVQFFGLSPDDPDSSFQLKIQAPAPMISMIVHEWLPSPEGAAIPITLFPGTTLRGRVEDAFGRPSPKAEVRALPLGASPFPPATEAEVRRQGRRPPSPPPHATHTSPLPSVVRCDDQGRFQLEGLPGGPCQLIAHPRSARPRIWVKKRLVLPSPGLLLLRLPQGGRLELRLPPKLPFASYVFLRSTDGETWTGASARIPIPPTPPPSLVRGDLPREALRVRLENPLGFHFTSNLMDFEEGTRLSLDLGPLRSATLKGRLEGKGGRSPRRGLLHIRLLEAAHEIQALGVLASKIYPIQPQENGRFRFGPVPAGTYELRLGSQVLGKFHLSPGQDLEKSFSLPW